MIIIDITGAKMRDTANDWLSFKEYEAVLWTLAQLEDYPQGFSSLDNDPMIVLLNEGHDSTDVVDTARRMQSRDDRYWISDGLTELQRSILRVSVENSTWVKAYVDHGALDSFDDDDCKATLRGLAEKLEKIGIEINHIPEA